MCVCVLVFLRLLYSKLTDPGVTRGVGRGSRLPLVVLLKIQTADDKIMAMIHSQTSALSAKGRISTVSGWGQGPSSFA